jgi:hypothetical protein
MIKASAWICSRGEDAAVMCIPSDCATSGTPHRNSKNGTFLELLRGYRVTSYVSCLQSLEQEIMVN